MGAPHIGLKTSGAGRGAFALAVGLAALAGFTDATAYVKFHGLFVSFMSGNTTKLAAASAVPLAVAMAAGRAILVFLVGVVVGELVGGWGGRWGRALVLLLTTLALAVAALADLAGQPPLALASLLGFAMGVQNASVHEAEGISMALTYVTGTLVHFAQAIAHALQGRAEWRAALPFLGLWLGLFGGAVAGALVATRSPAAAMIVAAGFAALLTLVAVLGQRESERRPGG